MNVFLADEQSMDVDTSLVVPLADLVMREERLPEESEVAVVLIEADEIAKYNETYLGRSGPTDVLSFPIETAEPGTPLERDADGPPVNLGDVFIAPEVVARNAADSGAPFEDEFALMVVHGILHLLGWDHELDDDAERMESRERQLLAKVGRTRP